jgi:hypothetical protein
VLKKKKEKEKEKEKNVKKIQDRSWLPGLGAAIS